MISGGAVCCIAMYMQGHSTTHPQKYPPHCPLNKTTSQLQIFGAPLQIFRDIFMQNLPIKLRKLLTHSSQNGPLTSETKVVLTLSSGWQNPAFSLPNQEEKKANKERARGKSERNEATASVARWFISKKSICFCLTSRSDRVASF